MNQSSKLFTTTNKPSQDQVLQALKKLRTIKYPVRPISNAILLKKKLNELNENLRSDLISNLDPKINAYRQVRGDGNCFFRAFAFSYITNKKIIYHDQLFNCLSKISLQVCKPQTIPKQFLPFYKDQLLKEILRMFWQKQYNAYLEETCNAQKIVNYKRALANLLLTNPYFDFIIILYFRAVCLFAFRSMKSTLKDFLKGTEEDEIKTWGQQSQGLVLDCMNRYFQINIFIFELRKNDVVKYQYQKSVQSKIGKNNIYLLYSNSHYDMLQINQDPLAEYQDQKIDDDYYSESSSRIYLQGTCIDCNKNKLVSTQTSLCKQCEIRSMKSLDTFQKDRFYEGFCNQCNKRSRNISQQLQICSKCIQLLQYAPVPSQKYGYSQPSIIKKMSKDPKEPITSQSVVKNSKIKPQDYNNSQLSIISTLNDKLESKIRKQAKLGQQKNKPVKQTVMRAKIQFAPQHLPCFSCNKLFRVMKIVEQREALCPECELKGNTSKVSKMKQEMEKSSFKSGVKKPQLCRECNKPDDFYVLKDGICSNCLKKLTNRAMIRH